MIKKIIVIFLSQVLIISHVSAAPEDTAAKIEDQKISQTFSDRFSSYLKNIGLGIGGLNTSPFTSVSKQTSRNIFDPNLSFYLTGKWNIKNQLYFAPEFSYVYFPKYQNEYSKNITVYSLIFMSNVWRELYLRFGVSTFITTIWGDGGPKTMNDGSSTSTYYIPADVSKSYNTAPGLGAEYLIKDHWAGRLDLFLLSAWSKTARQISYSTSLHYYF